jgi:hypothetical protein
MSWLGFQKGLPQSQRCGIPLIICNVWELESTTMMLLPDMITGTDITNIESKYWLSISMWTATASMASTLIITLGKDMHLGSYINSMTCWKISPFIKYRELSPLSLDLQSTLRYATGGTYVTAKKLRASSLWVSSRTSFWIRSGLSKFSVIHKCWICCLITYFHLENGNPYLHINVYNPYRVFSVTTELWLYHTMGTLSNCKGLLR